MKTKKISTDSLLTVFSIAYFFSTPGEYLGLAIQRWLVNGQEPHDPHERGARMGQFLAMLHGFMALQTGNWLLPVAFRCLFYHFSRYHLYGRKRSPRSI